MATKTLVGPTQFVTDGPNLESRKEGKIRTTTLTTGTGHSP